MATLESLDNDILYQICKIISTVDGKSKRSLLALSRMSRTFRSLSEPYLFEEIKFGDSNSSGGPLQKCFIQVTQFRRHLEIHKHIRSMHFSTVQYLPDRTSLSEMFILFIQILQRIPKLQFFDMELREDHAEPCILAMRSANLVLPFVRELALGNYCDFMVSMCSNVTTVRRSSEDFRGNTGDGLSLVKAALAAPKLVELQYLGAWHMGMIDALLASPNHIEKLSKLTPPRHLSIKGMIQKLGQLPSLKMLAFENVTELGLGFYPDDPMGNGDYIDGDDEISHVSIQQRRGREAEEKILRMVEAAFGEHSKLEELWFEESSLYKKSAASMEGEKRIGKWVRIRTFWSYVPDPWY